METYRISDELLREAVKRTCEQEGAYYDELTQNASHHFSLHHRVRMHQIYRQLKKKKTEERKSPKHYETVYPSRLRPRYLLIVVLLMIAMSMTTLALEPIREGAYELVEKCFPDHTDISFKKMKDEVAKQKEEIKEFKPQKLDYVPMGYVMEGEETDKTFLTYSADYVNIDGKPLYYFQVAIEEFDFSVSSNGERIKKINVKAKKGYWIKDTGGWNHLLYVSDGYVYYLSGHENIKNLVNILEKNKKIK